MVFDAHTHAWGQPSPDHPYVNDTIVDLVDTFSVATIYEAEKLLADMDRENIDEAVVVGYPIYEWTDNWYTLETAAKFDRLHGIVMLDPFAEDAVEELHRCMGTDGIVGFRLGAICPYDEMWKTFDPGQTWLRDAIGETEFWETAAETDAVVQILVHHRQLDQAVELVQAYPDLTYLFDHFAHAGPETPPSSEAFAPFTELAEYDGVAVKLSEVQHRSETTFPYTDMHDHVEWLLEQFGRERVLWGSDYPNVSDTASYAEAFHWLDHVDTLSRSDLEWIRGRSFRSHVGL